MGKVSDMIKAIAYAEGLPEASVAQFIRHAREGGEITQGARGVNAPDMTFRDGANSLIAVNASPSAKDAAETIRAYRDLECFRSYTRRDDAPHRTLYEQNFPKELAFIGEHGARFGSVLEKLLEMASRGELTSFLRREGSAYIRPETITDRQSDIQKAEATGDAVAMDAAEAAFNELVDWPTRSGLVRAIVSFHRPYPFAMIEVSRQNGPSVEYFIRSEFIWNVTGHTEYESKLIDRLRSKDQKIIIEITHRTILSLADALKTQ